MELESSKARMYRLLPQLLQDAQIKMTIYFYKVDAPFGCFSNFSPHPIVIDDKTWSTVEHYYQAQKFLGSPHPELMAVIHQVETPEAAAAIGRDRQRILRPDWETVKTQVMHRAVLKKFLTHPEIQEILLATGETLIVEDSPTDYFWGCGADKTGKNHLGKILMRVRQQIRDRQDF